MKTLNRILIGTVLLATLFSCQDVVTYNDGYDDGMNSFGAPDVQGIYSPDDTDLQVPLTKGGFGEMIVLVGENLSNVTKITFNNMEVDLSEVYATSKKACFPLPGDMPEEITNKLYYETERGNTTCEFKLDVPVMEINGLYNEFALPGTSLQIKGKYFELYGFGKNSSSVIKFGDTELEIESVTDQVITAKLPGDIPDNSMIVVEWNGTEGHCSYQLPYRQTDNLVWDLANPSDYGIWGGKDFITDGSNTGDPVALAGSFFRVKGTYKAWSYTGLPSGSIILDEEVAANPSDYLFKFEVNSASDYPFYDITSKTGGYLIKLNGGNYQWKYSLDENMNTFGEWYTVTLELENVATAGLVSGKIALTLAMQPNVEWNVDHSFANIRNEKKIGQ